MPAMGPLSGPFFFPSPISPHSPPLLRGHGPLLQVCRLLLFVGASLLANSPRSKPARMYSFVSTAP
jgi:hypothetical protein